MQLIPFNFSRPALAPARSLDSLFDALYDSAAAVPAWSPRLDLHEDADAVYVQVDLPGVDKKDISVTLEEGLLSISGKRQASHQVEDKSRTWHRVERTWGSFERHLRLGDGVDAASVKAEHKDGVLTVRIPKKEAAKPRSIEVQ